MEKVTKKPAPRVNYVSPSQQFIPGFETPFSQKLDPNNRWVVLSSLIPWDDICNVYLKHIGVKPTGRPAISPRIVIGSMIIKHICNLDDRETVLQISENMYMQYFLGFSSFCNEIPFDASLFVEFRNRLGLELTNSLNEKIMAIHRETIEKSKKKA
jgi:IS5 family transposase